MDFFHKLAVVTGGGTGIGRRIVEAFAAAGGRVAFLDAGEEDCLRLAETLGPECLFMSGDISREDVLSEFAERVVSRFGSVDFLINAVCADTKGILSGCGYAEFSRTLQMGAAVPYLLVRLLSGAFSRDAAVVNVAFPAAPLPRADRESYFAARGALLALTRSLAVSLAGRARVNMVGPGWTDAPAGDVPETASPPLARAPQPDDIVALVLFLCGTGASLITGQHIAVGGDPL
ncbi:MAG: SDR family oxidoreductase [Desulfovibrio sp.]|nr:SDR family oxidoreductase [Desulfovibrio sp.]